MQDVTSDTAHSFTMATLPSTAMQVFNAAKHHQAEVSSAVAQLKKSVAGQKSAVKRTGMGHVSDDYDSEASNGHDN